MIDEKKLLKKLCELGKSVQQQIKVAERDKKEAMLEFALKNQIAMLHTVIKKTKEQPKIGEWIPCSERLPEDGVDVLVWFEYFRYGEYNRLFQTTGISFTHNGKWSGLVNGQSDWNQLSVIAWQPLPEPYGT